MAAKIALVRLAPILRVGPEAAERRDTLPLAEAAAERTQTRPVLLKLLTSGPSAAPEEQAAMEAAAAGAGPAATMVDTVSATNNFLGASEEEEEPAAVERPAVPAGVAAARLSRL